MIDLRTFCDKIEIGENMRKIEIGERMKKVVYLGLILCLVSGCMGEKNLEDSTGYHTITSKEVFQEIEDQQEDNFYIIDVRTPGEYAYGHIPTAINVPLNSIDTISEYVPSKNTKVIVYCQSGNRSKQAADRLLEIGYEKIFDLGGIQDWDYEIER